MTTSAIQDTRNTVQVKRQKGTLEAASKSFQESNDEVRRSGGLMYDIVAVFRAYSGIAPDVSPV